MESSLLEIFELPRFLPKRESLHTLLRLQWWMRKVEKMPTNQNAWIIIPLFNEESMIGEVVKTARESFKNVVCIDDGSTDESRVNAIEAGAVVVSHPYNLGQGAAIRTGIDYALQYRSAEYFVTFDADGQHSIEDAAKMLQLLASGQLDIVLGSRFLDARTTVSSLKRLVLKVAVAFENLFSGLRLTDAHNGLRAFNRATANQLRITQNRMAHASEITIILGKSGLRYAEFPVHINYTPYSKSKGQSLWNSINILSELWIK
jgi:glycosyltransferase involved in cell wall biosynthesis